MNSKRLFLICNAHLDPVWLWPWEEGLAETLSTFRTAADFCESYAGFVFCHNEALLYQWVEEYEPELFERIRLLVDSGHWHVMGGWYVQPDCNLPCGESFVRQILRGKRYFADRFGLEPMTAVNFDSFGHSRGLVQILVKSGYTSYLFCRPDRKWLKLPGDDFIWMGYDGSEVLAHRAPDHYNSFLGQMGERIETWLKANPERDIGLLLWGIGNHGGGPSREDLGQIAAAQAEQETWDIQHGRPEQYFELLAERRDALVRHAGDLNRWAVGCYTSMARVKHKYRRLENLYYSTEKILTHAALQKLVEYPAQDLQQALDDLLFCQFHDALPGSSTEEVETQVLGKLDHGIEILTRLRAKAFFALAAGEEPAAEGEFPILVYNPHPFEVETAVVCELQPPEPNFDRRSILIPDIYDSNGQPVICSLEKENSNIQDDQRKRVVFRPKLKAATMNRFSCYLKKRGKPRRVDWGDLGLETGFLLGDTSVGVSGKTGLVSYYWRYCDKTDVEFLQPESFKLLVMKDDSDPWGTRVKSYRQLEGEFCLMTPQEAARYAGVDASELPPVRWFEESDLGHRVEALFKYGASKARVRYRFLNGSSEFEVEIRVFWAEKDRMLKLAIPTTFQRGRCLGQVAYGVEEFHGRGVEQVAQKWISVVSGGGKWALSVINDGVHGFDFKGGELRLSLLRSPAYAGLPTGPGRPILRQDRHEPRMDQGEHIFRFWVQGGPAKERLTRIDREALVKNEPPMTLCCYPPGDEEQAAPGVMLSDSAVQLNALKMAEEGKKIILRLYNPTSREQGTEVYIPYLDMLFNVIMGRYEIKTVAVDLESGEWDETDLLER